MLSARITRLEAVNAIVGQIGMAPLVSIEDNITSDAAAAIQALDEVTRDVQEIGWDFNTETEFPLTRTPSGEIPLGDNILRIDVSDTRFYPIRVVQRGNRLYDKTNHTFIFTKDLVAEEVVLLLEWDELPQAVRKLITIRAARVFVGRVIGDLDRAQFTERDEALAMLAMSQFEAQTGDYTIFDNYDAARVLRRYDEVF